MELNGADYIQLRTNVEKSKRDFGETLYHYTSLNTFLSMISNREIWMSSTGSMNDRKEIAYFIELLEKELDKYKRQDFFDKVYDEIPLNYKYAFCLSTEKDDAAQWERYGDSAMGVCIGFNVEEWCKCLYKYSDIMFNRVFYNASVGNDKYCKIVENYFKKGIIEIYSSEEELIQQLIYAGNLHKHKSFKNEHEIRITTIDIMGHSMKTSFEKMVDEIIIGPKSQQNIDVLKQYMISKEMFGLTSKICLSQCPLR